MKRFWLLIPLLVLLAAPAMGQWNRPYYMTPGQAIQWQYGAAGYYNPAAIRQRIWMNQMAYRQAQLERQWMWRQNPWAMQQLEMRQMFQQELQNNREQLRNELRDELQNEVRGGFRW